MILIAALALAAVQLPSPARAGTDWVTAGGDSSAFTLRSGRSALTLSGFMQLWWVLIEGTENGLHQPATGDEAAQYSSGFSIRRARLATNLLTPRFAARLSLKFETDSPALRDAYISVPLPDERLQLCIGQMKVPSTYEVGVPAKKLDFLSRSWFSKNVVDYSLIRSPEFGNPEFLDSAAANRDIGLALKGEYNGRRLGGDYFALIGNGFGANRYSGGRSNPQEISGNEFGSYLYALRLSFGSPARPPDETGSGPQFSIRSGAHVSYNTHPDIVLDDRQTVLDIERLAWSGNLIIKALGIFELTGMGGQVLIEDDYDDDGRTDYNLTGWEVKGMADIIPNTLQLGFRYDALTEEWFENGRQHRLDSYTVGINYFTLTQIKFQLNYMWNILDSRLHPDIDDNILAASIQAIF